MRRRWFFNFYNDGTGATTGPSVVGTVGTSTAPPVVLVLAGMFTGMVLTTAFVVVVDGTGKPS